MLSIDCHDSDEITMDDLAKLQLFLSDHLNHETEVTWEYGIDEDLEPNHMRLSIALTFIITFGWGAANKECAQFITILAKYWRIASRLPVQEYVIVFKCHFRPICCYESSSIAAQFHLRALSEMEQWSALGRRFLASIHGT